MAARVRQKRSELNGAQPGRKPAGRKKRAIPGPTRRSDDELTMNLEPGLDGSEQAQGDPGHPELSRIKDLPKEVGVMLITAGIVGLILPGPGTPAIIAGGLALWPKAFGKLEAWLEERYPRIHRQSMHQIDRFLNDLERRYPYSDESNQRS